MLLLTPVPVARICAVGRHAPGRALASPEARRA